MKPRAVALVLVVLLVAVGAIWCRQTIARAERSSGNDLVGYMAASEALYAGGDPYHVPERFPYIYPLFLATIVRPLAALPVRAASVLWFALQCASLWFVTAVFFRLKAEATGGSFVASGFSRKSTGISSGAPVASAFPGPSSVEGSRKNSVLAIAILVAIFGDVLQIEFLNGQVNLIVVALMMAAVYFGDDRPHLGAALLGAAVALKLTPAILLVYWVVRRRPRFVAEAIAWGAGFILLPWLVVRGRLWTLYESYAREFILPRTGAAVHQREFFSVHGLAGWLTGETPGRVLMVALAAAVVLALVLWHRRLLARGDASFAPVASVYIAAMPLLSPMSEVHHLTAALPAAAYAVSANGDRTRVRYDVVAALAVFTVLIWIARFDRRGPWYFLALASVIAAAAFALRGDSSQN